MNITAIRKVTRLLGALDPEEREMALAWHREGAGVKRRKRRVKRAGGSVARKSHHKATKAAKAKDDDETPVKGKAALLKESKPRLSSGPKGKMGTGENSDEGDET